MSSVCRSADAAIRQGVTYYRRRILRERLEIRNGRDSSGLSARCIFACREAIWALLDVWHATRPRR